MTNDEIQVGRIYATKLGKQTFRVRIEAAKGDGWTSTDIDSGASIDIPSADKLRYEIDIKDDGKAAKNGKAGATTGKSGAAKANAKGKAKSATSVNAKASKAGGNGKAKAKSAASTKANAKGKASKTKPDRDGEPKKLGCLDAAAKLLGEVDGSLDCKEMIEAMAKKGYWESPKGKTPQATLSAAVQREIAAQGKNARFVKTARGKFSLNK